ncbi:MAG: DNA primase [Bacteroidetes bacterium]|nr:MAG: DNA primase [Bacteroidota bacterium]
MIDKPTIARIIDTADIVEVVSDFVSLQKKGKDYKGLCPFHDDKNPSMSVSPSRGIFKCFSCGAGGNSVHFVMEHERLTYPEALKYLARKYNIEIIEKEETEEERLAKTSRESLQAVSTYAQSYFHDILLNHKDGKAIGLNYFTSRGYNEDTIKKFGLGYSLEARDAFSGTAISKGYKTEFLVKTGLSIENNNKLFDRFAGRVMFPIHSISGNVIGFGGRTLRTDKKTAKYFNSPESELYHKSDVLYGLYFAKNAISKNEKCFLVEGYTDVISFHLAGIENVVASSGTALTDGQIRQIKRFTQNITVVYDGDEAGIKASLRGIDLLLAQGMNIKVLPLPNGEDPDTFSKSKSATELQEYIEESEQDFIKFKISLLLADTKDDPIKKAGVINNIAVSISKIPNRITRSVYAKECSRLLGISEEIILQDVKNKIYAHNKISNTGIEKPKEIRPKQTSNNNIDLNKLSFLVLEKEILAFMLKYGTEEIRVAEDNAVNELKIIEFINNEFVKDEISLKIEDNRLLFDEIVKLYKENGDIKEADLINHQDNKIAKLAIEILSSPYQLSKIHNIKDIDEYDKHDLRETVPNTINVFKMKIVIEALEDAEKNLIIAYDQKDNAKVDDILKKMGILSNIKIKLAEFLGRVIL